MKPSLKELIAGVTEVRDQERLALNLDNEELTSFHIVLTILKRAQEETE